MAYRRTSVDFGESFPGILIATPANRQPGATQQAEQGGVK